MKAISLIGRRADFDQARFQAYYEERHVPLALRFYRFSRYRRSYVEALDGDLPAFAVMPEFWSADQAANQAVALSPDGETIREDERRFMGEPRMAAAASETVLAARSQGMKRLVLFARASDGGRDRLREALLEWADGLHGGGSVTVDELTPMSQAGFVADMIVSHWTEADRFAAPLPDVAIVGTGRFTTFETAARLLQSGPETIK